MGLQKVKKIHHVHTFFFFFWCVNGAHLTTSSGRFFVFFFVCLFRLKASGAVLVAKLVTGSLAYDDIWFGGRTRNPWNIEEFSTGSSAGPAASTSAGYFFYRK